ncbi:MULTISPECIES: hypothetical protein [unclassified Cryobacterium]|uniref:hypothetical protein n=1 Tax=unclassified Cryobacterium TaxID=2649013 RepID=UPI00106D7FCF|nr:MULTISPECIES: hypothetical protein [unclassified Cryobacterium]TFB92296.1 hypothetical protein E3O39_17510 [Cryobacterium sp. MDB2-A-1]TFC10968.1 hypothetical protein E3O59_02375 [Cryobacterium sp. MDB2-33-2]TFC16093.1 hypothetical protein E3O35_00275 [Cryobacterium sp. MDB2-A-2]TFC19015.1 hypothetical protein E3O51_07285 [Cryobacterium sp. MDB2-10]TFC32104.1 hypothetical protein E3O55_06265 [Cryobacterium sp. MDB1-18-2]
MTRNLEPPTGKEPPPPRIPDHLTEPRARWLEAIARWELRLGLRSSIDSCALEWISHDSNNPVLLEMVSRYRDDFVTDEEFRIDIANAFVAMALEPPTRSDYVWTVIADSVRAAETSQDLIRATHDLRVISHENSQFLDRLGGYVYYDENFSRNEYCDVSLGNVKRELSRDRPRLLEDASKHFATSTVGRWIAGTLGVVSV